jgi:RHS repeat-associated protein
MPCRRSPRSHRSHRKSRHPTHYGWDGDRLVCTQSDSAKVHTVYEPGSFVPLLRISQDVNADSPKTEAEATEANARGLLALASKHGKPEKAVNPDDKPKEPIKLPGFGTAQWAALSKSFAHLAAKGYPEHIKTVLRQGGLDPDNITAMAKAAVAQQKAEQTAKLTIQMYHCNHLGTPIALLNTQGMIDWAIELDPWGNVLNEFNPKGIDQPIRMQGQQIDRESGLFYNRHRYYDPAMGRYITQDPIGLEGGNNLYSYVGGRPLHFIDPKGLMTSDQHNALTIEALWGCSGLSASELRALSYSTAAADWTPSWAESQDVNNAPWHAMARPGQSVESAKAETALFIKQQMSIGSTQSIGRAIHAAQDSAAGGHTNSQTYDGDFHIGHFMDDMFPNKQERDRAIQATKNLFPKCQKMCMK